MTERSGAEQGCGLIRMGGGPFGTEIHCQVLTLEAGLPISGAVGWGRGRLSVAAGDFPEKRKLWNVSSQPRPAGNGAPTLVRGSCPGHRA